MSGKRKNKNTQISNRVVLGIALLLSLLVITIGSSCTVGSLQKCTTKQDCSPQFPLCVDGHCAKCRVDSDCPVLLQCIQGLCLQPSKEDSIIPDSPTKSDTKLIQDRKESHVDITPDQSHDIKEMEAKTELPQPDEPEQDTFVDKTAPRSDENIQPEPHPKEEQVKEKLSGCRPRQSRKCYEGPAGTRNVGICREGRRICQSNRTWGRCLFQILPRKELCNKKDDNCNGKIDDNCTCRSGSSRYCYPSAQIGCVKSLFGRYRCHGSCRAGLQRCTSGKWGSCRNSKIPSLELCDGKDNNCNGKTDEYFPLKGRRCSIGQGSCRRAGSYVCVTSTLSLVCNVKPGSATKEACDGKDNDCDGSIDEGCSCRSRTTSACGSDVGECKRGIQKCHDLGDKNRTRWLTCVSTSRPSREICDGKDNDCDGTIDEGCSLPSQKVTRWRDPKTGSNEVTGLSFHRREPSQIFSSSNGTEAILWKISGTTIKRIKTYTEPRNIVAFAIGPRVRNLAFAKSDKTATFYLGLARKRKVVVGPFKERILAMSLETKSLLIASGKNIYANAVGLLGLRIVKKTMKGHLSTVTKLSRIQSSRFFTSGSTDRTIRIWDINKTSPIATLTGHKAAIAGIAWVKGRNTLYSTSLDRTIKYWDTSKQKLIKTIYTAPSSYIPLDLKLSPNNAWIAVIYSNGKLKIFSARQEIQVMELTLPNPPSGLISWSSDSKMLAVGLKNGYIHLWKIP